MAEDLKQMIVHELADRRSRSDIVQAVCERARMDWPHAEELVKQVEVDQAHVIAARQVPMLVFLSACMSAGGILILVYSLQLLLPALHGDLLDALLLLVAAIDGPLAFLLIGVAMIAGGVIGMHKTMLRYFET